MQLGVVIGQAISTVKHPSLSGWRLLVVQMLGAQGAADGEPILAIDNHGADTGSRVIVCNDGAHARQMVGSKQSPVRWFVMGICDQ